MEKSLGKILKLAAESDSLTEVGNNYIQYLYFHDILITFATITIVCGIIYIFNKIGKG